MNIAPQTVFSGQILFISVDFLSHFVPAHWDPQDPPGTLCVRGQQCSHLISGDISTTRWWDVPPLPLQRWWTCHPKLNVCALSCAHEFLARGSKNKTLTARATIVVSNAHIYYTNMYINACLETRIGDTKLFIFCVVRS